MLAAERFAAGQGSTSVAKALRVHVRSVQRWRAAWEVGGEAALVSKGPPNRPHLSDAQFTLLEAELECGPAAHGWPDQKWTLGRIKTIIGRRFHLSYTVQGVHYLLRRHGWSHQVPARRAIERDEAAIVGWVRETWPQVEEPGRRSEPGWSSKTRPGSR